MQTIDVTGFVDIINLVRHDPRAAWLLLINDPKTTSGILLGRVDIHVKTDS